MNKPPWKIDAHRFDNVASLVSEYTRRSSEALRIYRPMPSQDRVHTSLASEMIVRGGNQSGKSCSAFAETASAATQTQLHDSSGKLIPFKYPMKDAMLIWLIGYDENHISTTIYRMLFTDQNGLRMIRDEQTKEWRSWRPWQEYDMAYEEKTKPFPPFIPSRLINPKGWSWKSRADNLFNKCTLTNGNEIRTYSSGGNVSQGDPVDLIHIDEDIENPKYVAEWQARLARKGGRIIWSAFPHSKNDALVRMAERAEAQREMDSPDIEEVRLKFSSNPFFKEDEKRKMLNRWAAFGNDELRARDDGEFMTDNVLVYPTFNKRTHDVFAVKDDVSRILSQNGNTPPRDWTRYMSMDPGHSTCAVLFIAVPPPYVHQDVILVYDELYMHRLDARRVAERVYKKVAGYSFREFIIDFRAGRQTAMGVGKTFRQIYSEAFAECGIRSEKTKSSFRYGSDNVQAGIQMVREKLDKESYGGPHLRIVVDRCPMLCREFLLYKKRVVRDEAKEEPVDANNHAQDALRYVIASNPAYHKPQPSMGSLSPGRRAYLKWQDLGKEERKSSEYMSIGPGAAS